MVANIDKYQNFLITNFDCISDELKMHTFNLITNVELAIQNQRKYLENPIIDRTITVNFQKELNDFQTLLKTKQEQHNIDLYCGEIMLHNSNICLSNQFTSVLPLGNYFITNNIHKVINLYSIIIYL